MLIYIILLKYTSSSKNNTFYCNVASTVHCGACTAGPVTNTRGTVESFVQHGCVDSTSPDVHPYEALFMERN